MSENACKKLSQFSLKWSIKLKSFYQNSEYEKLLKDLKKSHSERESKMKKDDTVFHEELKEFMVWKNSLS